MRQGFAALVVLVWMVALATESTAATRKQRPPPGAERGLPHQASNDQDEFKSCDVAVRDFVQGRREATALPVKEVKVDGLRMTLNFVHPYGESGETPPNLAFTRGESVEERRRTLNETKLKIRTLAEAAQSGNVWYVIALGNDNTEPSNERRPARLPPDENSVFASAVVMASIDNKCVTVSEYRRISLDRLSEDLRLQLGEKAREPSPSRDTAAPPPS